MKVGGEKLNFTKEYIYILILNFENEIIFINNIIHKYYYLFQYKKIITKKSPIVSI